MKAIAKSAIRKSFDLVGLEVHRRNPAKENWQLEEGSLVVPKIWDQPLFQKMVPVRLQSVIGPVILLGSAKQIEFLSPGLVAAGREVKGITWNWDTGLNFGPISDDASIIICKLPQNENHWRVVKQLKSTFGTRVIGIQELVLPFTTLQEGQASFDYSVDTLAEIVPLYLGDEYYGPLDDLDKVFPLAGKTVIEFGPMEGAQTAGLVHLGVKSVTAIEARAVSLIKSMIASYCFDWKNVSLVMDDFHNADAEKYGRFDLAFAHGVYYHSFAPFLFFENLMSLADNIFIGGYTAAANQPLKESTELKYTNERLEYEGKSYRVKRYVVGNSYNTAINQFAYHFDRQELMQFFEDRGYEIAVITDEACDEPWGDWFLRFLASKKKTQ